jgi:hypothetical protein
LDGKTANDLSQEEKSFKEAVEKRRESAKERLRWVVSDSIASQQTD